jgi:hypothetical protein
MPQTNDNTKRNTNDTPSGTYVPTLQSQVMIEANNLKSQINQLHDMIEFMDERDKRELFELICAVIAHLEPFEALIEPFHELKGTVTQYVQKEVTAAYLWHKWNTSLVTSGLILEGDVWHDIAKVERHKIGDDEHYTTRIVVTTTEGLTFTLTRDETVTVRI